MSKSSRVWVGEYVRPHRPCRCGVPSTAAHCAACGERLDYNEPEATWLEVCLGDGWVMAYRLHGDEHGNPVVAEVRVFPDEYPASGRPAGRWAAERTGRAARVPVGGVTGRVLRAVTPDRHLRESLPKLFAMASKVLDAGRTVAEEVGFDQPKPRRGPKGHGDAFYARVARDYVRAVERGKRDPTAAVARLTRWHDYTPENVRDFVHRARRRGLLTDPPRPGVAGGHLTDAARRLL